MAAFEHQYRDRNAEQDKDAHQADGRYAPEILRAHQRDQHTDPGQHGQSADPEKHAPLQAAYPTGATSMINSID
jgi:hypothetical protein